MSFSILLAAFLLAIAIFGVFGALMVVAVVSLKNIPDISKTIFVIVVPAVVAGALLGGGGAALLSASLNNSWLFWGPLAGLIGGGIGGLLVGGLLAIIQYRRKEGASELPPR